MTSWETAQLQKTADRSHVVVQVDAASDLAAAMAGSLIGYDAIPYQLATADHDRLEKRHIDGHSYYLLDEKAASDFVKYWKRRGV